MEFPETLIDYGFNYFDLSSLAIFASPTAPTIHIPIPPLRSLVLQSPPSPLWTWMESVLHFQPILSISILGVGEFPQRIFQECGDAAVSDLFFKIAPGKLCVRITYADTTTRTWSYNIPAPYGASADQLKTRYITGTIDFLTLFPQYGIEFRNATELAVDIDLFPAVAERIAFMHHLKKLTVWIPFSFGVRANEPTVTPSTQFEDLPPLLCNHLERLIIRRRERYIGQRDTSPLPPGFLSHLLDTALCGCPSLRRLSLEGVAFEAEQDLLVLRERISDVQSIDREHDFWLGKVRSIIIAARAHHTRLLEGQAPEYI